MDTCVLHNKNTESVDHLLLNCDFLDQIWHFFKQNFGLHSHPRSISDVWTTWILSLQDLQRLCWDLLSRAIFWNLWLERNHHIFELHSLTPHSVISKITYMLLAWIFAARDPSQRFLGNSIQKLRRSIDFLSTCLNDQPAAMTTSFQEWSTPSFSY